MTDFATALQEQLESKGKLSGHEKRILVMLKDDSPRRKRRLRRMEANATEAVRTQRVANGQSAAGPIDWGSQAIDWKNIFEILIKLLPLLLAIL